MLPARAYKAAKVIYPGIKHLQGRCCDKYMIWLTYSNKSFWFKNGLEHFIEVASKLPKSVWKRTSKNSVNFSCHAVRMQWGREDTHSHKINGIQVAMVLELLSSAVSCCHLGPVFPYAPWFSGNKFLSVLSQLIFHGISISHQDFIRVHFSPHQTHTKKLTCQGHKY